MKSEELKEKLDNLIFIVRTAMDDLQNIKDELGRSDERGHFFVRREGDDWHWCIKCGESEGSWDAEHLDCNNNLGN